MANPWFETVAIAQARAKKRLPSFVYGALIANGGYDARAGNEVIARGEADLVAYGVPFVSNPDLPARYKNGSPLNPADRNTSSKPSSSA